MNRLLFLLALTAGCQRQSARPRADSQRLPNGAAEVCNAVAKSWGEVPFSHVERRDTIAHPVNRDALHPNLPDEELGATAACRVVARADSGIEHKPRPLYWPAADWVPILAFGADGPDGGSMLYQRALTRCYVSNSWDGEDDSDSTYVPQKWFEQRTTCWQHDRALVPSDTAQP